MFGINPKSSEDIGLGMRSSQQAKTSNTRLQKATHDSPFSCFQQNCTRIVLCIASAVRMEVVARAHCLR